MFERKKTCTGNNFVEAFNQEFMHIYYVFALGLPPNSRLTISRPKEAWEKFY